jgi:hypothetical protein
MTESTLLNIIEVNESKLQEVHAEHYTGTDDDMPEAFDNWLDDIADYPINILS